MVWTKQTARRSTGGKAPCKALATKQGGKESGTIWLLEVPKSLIGTIQAWWQ
jgi:hypothetical protein